MELRNLNPCIRYIAKRSVTESYPKEVLAYDFRLFSVVLGSLRIDVDGTSFFLTTDNLLIIPPATPYRILAGEKNEFYLLNFDMTQEHAEAPSITPSYKNKFNPSLVICRDTPDAFASAVLLPAPQECKEMLGFLGENYSARPSLFDEESSARLKLLLLLSLRARQENLPCRLLIAKSIRQYIEEHHREPLTNEWLASEFRYHPNHLNRLFREATGVSLHHYVIECRLKEAKELLAATDDGIESVATRVGFESPSYFSKYFREKFGISPFAFRESHRKWLF